MNTGDAAAVYLEHLGRLDLAALVRRSHFELSKSATVGFGVTYEYHLKVFSPAPYAETLAALQQQDRKRIAAAFVADLALEPNIIPPADYESASISRAKLSASELLIADLIRVRELMINVATGGQRIQDVEDDYRVRHSRSKETAAATGVPYDNPHVELWHFFDYWRANMPTYQERRTYVRRLLGPAVAEAAVRTSAVLPTREPTGWARVDRALASARGQYGVAKNEEDFQAIGLLCREVLISVAQAVYDPSLHSSADGVKPSATDAKRMLEAFLHSAVPGDSYKEVRAHARASVDLSLNLQHRRTATRQLAALCLEAAASTAAVIAILSNRHAIA